MSALRESGAREGAIRRHHRIETTAPRTRFSPQFPLNNSARSLSAVCEVAEVVSCGFVVRALFFSATTPCARIGATLPFLSCNSRKSSGLFYYLLVVTQAQEISHYRKLPSARLNTETISK